MSCFLSCSIAPPAAARSFDFGVASTSIHLSNRSIVSCIDPLYTSKLRTWEILDGRLQADGYLLLLLDARQCLAAAYCCMVVYACVLQVLGGAGRRLGRAELGQHEGRWWRRRTYAWGRRGTHEKKKNAKKAEWNPNLIIEHLNIRNY